MLKGFLDHLITKEATQKKKKNNYFALSLVNLNYNINGLTILLI